jgi:hypothetical protein
MGGGFGGKETQGNSFAAIAALAAKTFRHPVKLRPDRDDDFQITGKRHDFSVSYDVGYDDDGRIQAVAATFAARCGFSADLSGPVTDRALFHCDNAYWYPAVRVNSLPPDEERKQIAEAIRLHTLATGERPTGWYTGRSSLQTVDLVSEEGGFEYVSDTYDDDLPYWRPHKGRAQLIIPYTLAANDMRFVTAPGFDNGEEYYQFLKDSFDVLYEEGRLGSPKMMSLGLHCRLVGMPGRFAGLKRFLDYIQTKDKVWIARRVDIARHWAQHHPYQAPSLVPSEMDRTQFVGHFGSIFEHSPWIAERAFDGELGPVNDTASTSRSVRSSVPPPTTSA